MALERHDSPNPRRAVTPGTGWEYPGSNSLKKAGKSVMWEPGVIVSLVVGVVAIIGQIISITVFVVKLGGKIDVNNTRIVGKIDVIDHRVRNVEANIADLKNTDRRLSLVEDRQAALATRQGNMEQDNLMIRQDLGLLHQGLDRHSAVMQQFNESQFTK